MEIKITNKIPLPSQRMSYPFEMMNVGESFYVNGGTTRLSVAVAACNYGKRTNKKFTVRAEKTGFRCWRTA